MMAGLTMGLLESSMPSGCFRLSLCVCELCAYGSYGVRYNLVERIYSSVNTQLKFSLLPEKETSDH